MPSHDRSAMQEFRRMLKWIMLAAVLMVAGAIAYLAEMDSLSVHAVIASVLGVFFSVLLGCGLFALAFFSDKSGHDDDVTDAAKGNRPPRD